MGLKTLELLKRKDKEQSDNKDRQRYNAIKASVQELCQKYVAQGGILTVEISPSALQDFQQYTMSNEFVARYSYQQHEEDPNVYDIQMKDLIEF